MAAGLVVDIERETGIDVGARGGDDGVFDVFLDGELVFSKTEAKRLPQTDELIDLVRKRRGTSGAD